jgi:hypothetical protein
VVKTVLDPAQFIVGSRQSLNGNTDPHPVTELLEKLDNPVGEVAV